MKDYLVYGTRYSGFGRMLEWISDHCDARCIKTDVNSHIKNKYDKKSLVNRRYFLFAETSLVYNERLMLCRNTTNYTKSIIVFRDIYDVIENVLQKTRVSVDKVISKQTDLFEEYSDELLKETHYIPEGYELFINYRRWLMDVDYRNKIGSALGFENSDKEVYELNMDKRLRNSLRFKKYKTKSLTDLNKKTLYSDNSLYM